LATTGASRAREEARPPEARAAAAAPFFIDQGVSSFLQRDEAEAEAEGEKGEGGGGGDEDDLERKIMSPQELFNTAINMKCWEMALEVMDVLHDAGIVQPDGPQVVDRLWNLLLNNAWDAGGSDHRSKWAKLEITLVCCHPTYYLIIFVHCLQISFIVQFCENASVANIIFN
jgi:hypothetical protein